MNLLGLPKNYRVQLALSSKIHLEKKLPTSEEKRKTFKEILLRRHNFMHDTVRQGSFGKRLEMHEIGRYAFSCTLFRWGCESGFARRSVLYGCSLFLYSAKIFEKAA